LQASDTETTNTEPFEEKEGEKENLIANKSHLQAFKQKLIFSKENGLYLNQNVYEPSEISNTLEQEKSYANGESEILSTPLAERLNVPINLGLMVNELEEVTTASKPLKDKVEGLMKILEYGFLSTKPPADGIKSEPGVHHDMEQILKAQMSYSKNSMIQFCKNRDPECKYTYYFNIYHRLLYY
jgi:hypothetical protein